MMNDDLLEKYNYAEFVPASFGPWLRFHESPPVGSEIQNFDLWQMDKTRTSLSDVLARHRYTVIEFGSFT